MNTDTFVQYDEGRIGQVIEIRRRNLLLRPPERRDGSGQTLPIRLGEIDNVLPEGGLPRGAVVEVASPRGLGRATLVALRACASAQHEAKLRGGEETVGAWCAWLDPSGTLFAPGVACAGVDLARLLVVRPPAESLARVAVRVAGSHAFGVVVVDLAGVPGKVQHERLDRWATIVVRRLAIAAEKSDTTILLLTDVLAHRALQLPVAMRVELDRPSTDRMILRVAKDRRGRLTSPTSIPMGARERPTDSLVQLAGALPIPRVLASELSIPCELAREPSTQALETASNARYPHEPERMRERSEHWSAGP